MKTQQVRTIQIGNATVSFNEGKLRIQDEGVKLEHEFEGKTPEDLASAAIKAVWDMYYRSEKNTEKRAKSFEAATGLYPCSVTRVFVRNTRARRSGDAWISVHDGKVTLTIAPACSSGSRFPKIENREYDVTEVFHRLVKFFSC